MDEKEIQAQIQTILEEILSIIGLQGSVVIGSEDETTTRFVLVVDTDQQYLIGKHGTTLDALQHIVSGVARKQKSARRYRVDINGYKEERQKALIEKVESYLAEKADDSSVLLWPMSSYERRVIHEYFLTKGTHDTESEDFGSQRVVRVTKK